jgi:hypothetical protein
MPSLETFYLDKESRILIGNTGIAKDGYLAPLCFLTDNNEFINICLTKEQLISIQKVITQGLTVIDKELEKNNVTEADIEQMLRERGSYEK